MTPPTPRPGFQGDHLGLQAPLNFGDVVKDEFLARKNLPGLPRRNGVSDSSSAACKEANSVGTMT